jgi:UDP-glucose 4,6-dehydratase
MKSFFITGAAGFIGSHLAEYIFHSFPKSRIIALDKLTYAGNKFFLKEIINDRRVKFIRSDIIDTKKYFSFLKKTDCAINLAAESHVDNSFVNSTIFTKTNTFGAHIFLQNCIQAKVKKIIHISTDEVYGDKRKGISYEVDKLDPTNPYSASKAAAEMIVNSYNFFIKKKIIIVRANNIYGTRQHKEKLIPQCIYSLLKNKRIPIHGNGKNKRHYLSVNDFCSAIKILVKKKVEGIFNIGSEEEFSNFEIANKICQLMNFDPIKKITFVKDRPFNDTRYSVSYKKIKKLGFKNKKQILLELPKIIDWYKKNYNKLKL